MNYIEVGTQILKLVGDEKNVTNFSHCVTRLRFNVRDKEIVDVEKINGIKGVIGSQWQGEQLQIIVGAEVEQLYSTICKMGEFEKTSAIEENLDPTLTKKKFSARTIVDKVFNYLSPMMTTIIPVMVGASLFKVIGYLLGPDILGVISAESGLYIVLDIMYDSFFYFLPVFLGYVAAKTLNYNPIYGIYIGALIIAPDLISLVGTADKLSVLGIPVPLNNYSSSFLPVVLGGLLMNYVLKFMEKHIPTAVKSLLVPFLSMLIMSIVMLAVCAPLGTYIGVFMGKFFMYLSSAVAPIRILGAVVLTIAWPFLILLGMHGGISAFAFSIMTDYGYDPYLFNTAYIANVAVFGIALGAALKFRNKENKTVTLNYFATCILGGITEPILYGVMLKYRKTIIGLITSCAVGGLLAGIFVPKLYVYTSTSVLGIWACWMSGGNTSNVIVGNVILVITFIVAVVATYLQKYDDTDTAVK